MMATLFIDNTAAEDTWLTVEGDQPVPGDGDVIVSLEIFKGRAGADFASRNGRLGVFLSADEPVQAIADRLDEIDLVALDFPSFADGRAFSKATILRKQHGFTGEVRAVGDIRIDQTRHMKRCGFNALLIRHQPTIDALLRGDDPALTLYYQPCVSDSEIPVKGRSWQRRAMVQVVGN